MNQSTKTNVQLAAILLVAAAFLIGLFILGGGAMQPSIVVAQEPLTDLDAARRSFSQEILDQYGLSLDDLQPASAPSNVQVTVTSNNTNIPSNGTVVYTVTITNLGTNLAEGVLFSHTLPQQLSNVSGPSFSVATINNGANPPTWLLPNPIPNGGSVQVTISGKLTSQCNTSTAYIAKALLWNSSHDPNLNNNTATRNVNVVGAGTCTYLPIVSKNPTPTPNPIVFSDNFSDDNWATADDSDCERDYVSGEYEITAQTSGEECFSPAPGGAEREHGTFRVTARRHDGSSNFTVAIYINGEGAGNYYAFEVNPDDDCGWELIRRSGGSSSTKRSGGCDAAINQNSGSNILQIRHTKNGDKGNISVFINGIQMGTTYTDDDPLDGEGAGIYTRTNKDAEVSTRYDNFTVLVP